MIEGELLCESGAYRYSPWFSREGDQGVFGYQVIAVSNAAALSFSTFVETKNSTDTDAAAASLGGASSTTVGVFRTGTLTGMKELVRYKYFVTSDPFTGTEWVHFQMLDPAWLLN